MFMNEVTGRDHIESPEETEVTVCHKIKLRSPL